MPPVSHPFKKGALVILMNYNDHAPPHVHVKYQGDVRSYRIEIRTKIWLRPGKKLPSTLRKMVETWVEAHEQELLEQWENAQNNQSVVRNPGLKAWGFQMLNRGFSREKPVEHLIRKKIIACKRSDHPPVKTKGAFPAFPVIVG